MNSERFNHLVAIINHDLKQAEIRRDAFSKDSQEYSFNHATVLALKCVLFDMKQLKLIK
jgi:hypothetical protein